MMFDMTGFQIVVITGSVDQSDTALAQLGFDHCKIIIINETPMAIHGDKYEYSEPQQRKQILIIQNKQTKGCTR